MNIFWPRKYADGGGCGADEEDEDTVISKSAEIKIAQLRNQGIGYKEIGRLLSLSRDDVRNYCRKTGLSGRMSGINKTIQTEESVSKRVSGSKNAIQYIEGYERNTGRILVRCLVCGYEWSVLYNHAVYGHVKCPWCRDGEREYSAHIEWINKATMKWKAQKKKEEWESKHKKNCIVCGKEFISLHGAQCCSQKCRKKYENRRRDKRIAKDLIDDPEITLESLYRRDNGICHICGKPCNYEDYTVDGDVFIAGNWYPSIDHVVPVSKGGRHSWDNVKLAHRLCNSVKSNKT